MRSERYYDDVLTALVKQINYLERRLAVQETVDGIGIYVDLASAQTVAGVKTWSSNAVFSGSVGIGTTSPDGFLHVDFTNYADSVLFRRSPGAATGVPWASFRLRAKSSGSLVDGFGPSLQFQAENSTGTVNNAANIYAIRSGTDTSYALQFAPFQSGTANTRMTILPDGNVGIGTAAPDAQLDVVSGDAGRVALRVKAAASPTVNIQEWRSSAGTLLQSISQYGGIKSGEESVADDSIEILYTNVYVGFLMVWVGGQSQGYALLHIRSGQSSPFAVIVAGGTLVEATTSTVTGTTGTDGKLTVSATATSLTIENRIGATVIVRWLQIR